MSKFRRILSVWKIAILVLAFFLGGISATPADAYVNVRGYYRKDGTYVRPHVRSNPNGIKWDNYSWTPSQGLYNETYGTRGNTWDTPTYITDPDYYEGKSLYESGKTPTVSSIKPNLSSSKIDPVEERANIAERVRGRILLQTQSIGEAWYVNPLNEGRYYMKSGADALRIMRQLGLGITNKDISSIPIATSISDLVDKDTCIPIAKQVKGRILLQVESNGEAWYVHPDSCKRVYLGNGEVSYQIMRSASLGITNSDLAKIPTIEGDPSLSKVSSSTNSIPTTKSKYCHNIMELSDSDHDGHTNLMEVVKGSDPLNRNQTPITVMVNPHLAHQGYSMPTYCYE